MNSFTQIPGKNEYYLTKTYLEEGIFVIVNQTHYSTYLHMLKKGYSEEHAKRQALFDQCMEHLSNINSLLDEARQNHENSVFNDAKKALTGD